MTNNLDAIKMALPHLPNIAFLLDPDLRYLGVTIRFAELMQVPPERLEGKFFKDMPLPGNADWESVFSSLLKQEEPIISNVKFENATVQRRFECRTKPVFEANGELSGVLLSLERDPDEHFRPYTFPISPNRNDLPESTVDNPDSTVAKQLEDYLYQSEERFRQTFEHSLIGMAIVSCSGKWLRVNESLCQFLGYSENELQAMTMQEITHPDDLEKSTRLLAMLNDGSTENIKLEKRYIHKDGSVIWVMLAATMLKDRSGEPVHYVSHMENITSRKEIERNLIHSEAKYRAIFENVQDVFYQTDQEGYVTEISPSIDIYSGYSRADVIGRHVSDFYYYEDDRNRIVKLLQQEGSVIDFEVRLKTRNEQLKYASVNARIVKDQSGGIITEGSMRDVTARKFQENALKNLNAELQASNEQKNKLLSIIGHDLRNPISGGLQLLDLILMDVESSSTTEIHTYLSKMKQELGNANNLLEELLTWAKTQFDAFSFNPVYTADLRSLLRNCVDKVLPMALNKGVALKLNVEEGAGITADVGMLETIIRNLVSNAIKFTVKGDQIKLRAFRVEAGIQFSVQDTGLGISPDIVKQLFNRNINYTTYGTSGEKGTGLGLNICYDFVAKHGGEIWVESVVGKGSTFNFTIPQSA
jgi:PAS domain S-box-containing protein